MEPNNMPEAFELAEVSAAKNIALARLEEADMPEETDRIEIADRIVNDLIKAGVLIPGWIGDPFDNHRPAQGYHPTASQMEKWEGRKVTPSRVTGR
jgi:hypothetical protein